MRTDVSGALKTDMHILAAVAFLALAFSTGPLSAFDISDLRQLRDSSYRSCPKCDLSGAQLQGANLRRAQLQGANLAHAVLEDADLSFAVLEGAVLYEAVLRDANLNTARLLSANLRGAELQNADLSYAELEYANLYGALLQGAKLVGTQLQSARLGSARLNGAILSGSDLSSALLRSAELQGADLVGARLENADLNGAQLQKANLSRAHLQNATMIEAQLHNAILIRAELQNANLRRAQLQNAVFLGAQLQNADLLGAQLQNADLRDASLQSADLSFASVEGAKLAFSDLSNAAYQPTSPPPDDVVFGIRGLATIEVRDVSGLVQLRELLRRAGERELERAATSSIERSRTSQMLAAWPNYPLWALEGALRLVAFELTTGYGLYPARALLILLGLMVLLSGVYLPWVARPGQAPGEGDQFGWSMVDRVDQGAIYRIWPNERLLEDSQGVRLVIYGDVLERQRAERLHARSTFGRYGYALWFSVLSAFHIGWRELSIGTWLSRLQPREYALRAQGLPRIISGVQSLISVYLIAIWALTYFGRPFQ